MVRPCSVVPKAMRFPTGAPGGFSSCSLVSPADGSGPYGRSVRSQHGKGCPVTYRLRCHGGRCCIRCVGRARPTTAGEAERCSGHEPCSARRRQVSRPSGLRGRRVRQRRGTPQARRPLRPAAASAYLPNVGRPLAASLHLLLERAFSGLRSYPRGSRVSSLQPPAAGAFCQVGPVVPARFPVDPRPAPYVAHRVGSPARGHGQTFDAVRRAFRWTV